MDVHARVRIGAGDRVGRPEFAHRALGSEGRESRGEGVSRVGGALFGTA